jgi:hypothetical protein
MSHDQLRLISRPFTAFPVYRGVPDPTYLLKAATRIGALKGKNQTAIDVLYEVTNNDEHLFLTFCETADFTSNGLDFQRRLLVRLSRTSPNKRKSPLIDKSYLSIMRNGDLKSFFLKGLRNSTDAVVKLLNDHPENENLGRMLVALYDLLPSCGVKDFRIDTH